MSPPRSARLVRARRGPDGRGDGGAVDRISNLTNDLLLRILSCLHCARAAARTSLVSRRWRDLWALLPEIYLRLAKAGSFYASLAQLEAARSKDHAGSPAVLHFESVSPDRMCSALLVGSLLSCAERLAPGELSIVATSTYTSRKPIQLPCFDRTDSMDLPRTKSIDLTLGDFRLLPPKAGNCPAERLALEGCHFDAAALLPRCPRLRVLQVGPNAKLASDSSRTIHYLPLLEELVLEDCIDGLRFHIVAPMLNHLSLFTHIKDASVSAENLEKLSLDCSRNLYNIELGNMGGLREVMLWIFRYRHRLLIHKGVRTLMQQLPHLRLLSVNISLQRMTAFKGLIDENAFVGLQKLPKTSMLMLQLSTFGHRYRKTVLLLLKMFEGIEELIMLIDSPKEVSAPGFHCSNEVWTSEDLSLPLLKKVEFKGFTGSKSAVYVLKLLLTSAKVLEQMTVTLCNKDSTGYEGRKQQLFNIFNSYPTVKCQVLHA